MAKKKMNQEPGKQNDMPAAFRRALQMQQARKEGKRRPKPQESNLTKRKPHETMSEYTHRLDTEAREALVKIAKSGTRKVTKRKEFVKKKKAKKLDKTTFKLEERKEEDRFREKVKFGDIVQQPPEIKIVPKDREAEKKRKLQEFFNKHSGDAEESTEVVETRETKESEPSTKWRKTKLKNLEPAQRRILEAERKKVIESYRSNKAKSMVPGPGKDE